MLGNKAPVPMSDGGCLTVLATGAHHQVRSAKADNCMTDGATCFLVVLLMRRVESRSHLIRLTTPPEMVTSVLVRLWPRVDRWLVLAYVLLTLELLMRLS